MSAATNGEGAELFPLDRRGRARRSETLEGPTAAADGDWVVRGADGEEWPVPAQEFAERYTALDPAAKATPSPQT